MNPREYYMCTSIDLALAQEMLTPQEGKELGPTSL